MWVVENIIQAAKAEYEDASVFASRLEHVARTYSNQFPASVALPGGKPVGQGRRSELEV